MAAFPSIGVLLAGQFSEAPRPNVIRTDMEDGTTKQRKKLTNNFMEAQVTYLFDLTEYDTFQTFFHDTTENGSLYFDYTHPIHGAISTRIMNGAYSVTPLNNLLNHVHVTFALEWEQ